MRSFKVCIPLEKPTLPLLKKAEKEADLVELWIDLIPLQQIESLVKAATKPVLVTCKDKVEKGGFTGTPDEKFARLEAAVQAGARYVDCGSHVAPLLIKKLKKLCKAAGAKLILSTHYWEATPSLKILEAHANALYKRGADIVKIAAMLKNPEDTVTLFELATRLKKRTLPCVVVGMGPNSKVSRIGCALLGGEWTFVALDQKSATAPGQLLLNEV